MLQRGNADQHEQRPGWRPASRRLVSHVGKRGIALAAAIVLIAGGGGLWWSQHASPAAAKTAALVDQLSLTAPDAAFVTSTTQTLTHAGYRVDYYPGEQVTVEFFRRLPQHHYDLILIRAHSGLTTVTNLGTGEVTRTRAVSLFTGQPFDASAYQGEQHRGLLGRGTYVNEGSEAQGVFVVAPEFIRRSVEGPFAHTLIVLMGCNGVNTPDMARAFLDKGASAVVGWDDFVSADFTDKVTSAFLDRFLARRIPVGDAVTQTASEFGRDPSYGGLLQLVTSGR